MKINLTPMTFPTQASPRFAHFEPAGLDTLPTVAGQIARHCDKHWESILRPWLQSRECGMPTDMTLANHGTWLIPHYSHHRGLAHKLFRWRGVIVFEGWFDAVTGQHIIHPHTSTTPKPWEQPVHHTSTWSPYLQNLKTLEPCIGYSYPIPGYGFPFSI